MAAFLYLLFATLAVALPAQQSNPSSGPSSAEDVNTAGPIGSLIPPPPPSPPPVKAIYKGVSGIFPVYDIDHEWVMLDRRGDGRKKGLRPGSLVLVVGSRGTALFRIAHWNAVSGAACSKNGPVRVDAYVLMGRAKNQIGIPIIAIETPTNVKIDPKRAGFFPLSNQVNDETYTALGKPLEAKVLEDIGNGKFIITADDTLGQNYARNPDPSNVHTNIDFAATIHMAGITTAQALVSLSQMSKSSRRCFWLFLNDKITGTCAEMPHLLMAETNFLNFVSYDPNRDGHPFVLGYTTREPMWGHERWGFHVTRRGPSVFLVDTLDPKCRERF